MYLCLGPFFHGYVFTKLTLCACPSLLSSPLKVYFCFLFEDWRTITVHSIWELSAVYKNSNALLFSCPFLRVSNVEFVGLTLLITVVIPSDSWPLNHFWIDVSKSLWIIVLVFAQSINNGFIISAFIFLCALLDKTQLRHNYKIPGWELWFLKQVFFAILFHNFVI